jgi:hypothetical protein
LGCIITEKAHFYWTVKTIESSKNAAVRHESELIHHFRQLLDAEPDLKWRIPSDVVPAGERPSRVELQIDARTLAFKPVYFLKPGIPELEFTLADWKENIPPLLVAPELLTRILEFCRKKRLAAVDLNGRVYLRTEGVLVDRRSLPGRDFRFELEPRNVFDGKSARIIRSLLTDRDRTWTQKELVDRTKASPGLVSRIVQHLISQGFIDKQSPRVFRLRDSLGLIDAWVKADDFNRRVITTRYTAFDNNPLGVSQELNRWAEKHSVRIAFTQFIAGWLRQPYTEPAVTSAYVSRLPEPATLEPVGFRPVTDAGKVWLFVPDDEGVYLETRTVHGLPLVSDAQIYLDLQETGLRGPDQADALRHWEGFCRP